MLARVRKGDFPPFPRINRRKHSYEVARRDEDHFSMADSSILGVLSIERLKKDHAARLAMSEADREIDDFKAGQSK